MIRVALAVLLLTSCRGVATATADAGPCTKVNDSCEYAPGKLGLCVEVQAEAGPPTLLCQSQH